MLTMSGTIAWTILYIGTSQAVIGVAICERQLKRMTSRDHLFGLSPALGNYRSTVERIIRDQQASMARA